MRAYPLGEFLKVQSSGSDWVKRDQEGAIVYTFEYSGNGPRYYVYQDCHLLLVQRLVVPKNDSGPESWEFVLGDKFKEWRVPAGLVDVVYSC